MASTYTPLGIEKMATGENAGTWGTKTNTNLDIIEQVSGGYTTVNFGSDADVTLSVSDGSTGAALAHRILEFTSSGSLSTTRNCTIPLDVQNFYILKNSTTGGQTITFKYASGSGDSVNVLNGKTVIAYAKADDGTNPNIASVSLSSDLVDDTSPQLGGNLDTNSFMIDFDDAHGLRDENGNEQLFFSTTSSAVNYLNATNAATGNDPKLSALGDDSNIDLALSPKGSGEIVVGTGAAAATITSSGAHDLVLDTNSGTNSGNITITDAANGNITLTPNGTGDVVLAADTTTVGDAGAAATINSNGAGTLTVTTGGASDLILSTNGGTDSGTITITDAANGNIAITPNGSGNIVLDGLTFPNADGSADTFLKTNGSGTLSFAAVSGGTSWQAVKTSTFTAVAGEGYFVNTTSSAITMNLPAGTLGDEIAFIDYAGTFDSNTFTVSANGSEKIHGSTDDLTISTERAANTLVFTDSTQGWLLKNN